jgi:hypothetical protein
MICIGVMGGIVDRPGRPMHPTTGELWITVGPVDNPGPTRTKLTMTVTAPNRADHDVNFMIGAGWVYGR